MNNEEEIKKVVKEKYGEIAAKAEEKSSGCCGGTKASTCCGSKEDYSVFNDNYTELNGYVADADLNLGCGIPTQYAGIKEGDTVLDLGSGAGNDVFVARSIVGEKGRVIGLDMTEEMIAKAEINKSKTGYTNIEFVLGEIEIMPVGSDSIDVVISNCVLNLVPNKRKAFSEIKRALKSGGHFCISDVVVRGELPKGVKESASLYAGCVSGALNMYDYLAIIDKAGFKNIEVKKSKPIDLPDELLKEYLSEKDIKEFKESGAGIFSITVVAEK